jgi:hypothetical protein
MKHTVHKYVEMVNYLSSQTGNMTLEGILIKCVDTLCLIKLFNA